MDYRQQLRTFVHGPNKETYDFFIKNLPMMRYSKDDYEYTRMIAPKVILAALVYHDLQKNRLFTKHQIEYAMYLNPKFKNHLAVHPNRRDMAIVNLISH